VLPITSRKEARERGLKRYFTGKPCKLGHAAERLTSDRGCVECKCEWVRCYRKANPDHRRQWYAENADKERDRNRQWYAAYCAANPEYGSWHNMVQRCTNPNATSFERYGGRDDNPITVCDRWLVGENGMSGFECFIADLGPKPTPQHSIDRTNNDLGYFPANCRWATPREQNLNQRPRLAEAA
jgi:hypothetical protein